MNYPTICVSMLASALSSHCALAGLTVVAGASNAYQWFDNAGAFSTITATEYPTGTPITDQYAALGVQVWTPYPTIPVRIAGPNAIWQQDGFALTSWGRVDFIFDTPMHGFAAYYSGMIRGRLFQGSEIVGMFQVDVGGGLNKFVGVFSDVEFDRVMILKGWDYPGEGLGKYKQIGVELDNIYFTTVPAPGAAWAIVGLLAMSGSRWRSGERRLRVMAGRAIEEPGS